MSIAIHITTHAPLSDVKALLDGITDLVEDLDTDIPEGRPASTWRVYGNDYSDPGHPIRDIALPAPELLPDEIEPE
jgi:hypothetical protein